MAEGIQHLVITLPTLYLHNVEKRDQKEALILYIQGVVKLSYSLIPLIHRIFKFKALNIHLKVVLWN